MQPVKYMALLTWYSPVNKKDIVPQTTLFVPRDNVILRGIAPLVPGFLSPRFCDIKFVTL